MSELARHSQIPPQTGRFNILQIIWLLVLKCDNDGITNFLAIEPIRSFQHLDIGLAFLRMAPQDIRANESSITSSTLVRLVIIICSESCVSGCSSIMNDRVIEIE